MSLGLSSCVNLKKSYCPLSCRSCLLRLAWDPAVCPLALWCSFLVSAACFGVFPVVVPVPLPLHVRARTAWLKSKVGGLLAVGFRWQAVCFYLCTSCSCQFPHTTMCHYPNVCVYVFVCVPLHPWPFSEILHQGASIVVIQVASLLISKIAISGGVLSLDALPTTTARLSSSATAIADSAKTATVVTCLSEVFQISGFVVGCLDDMLNCFTRLLVLVAWSASSLVCEPTIGEKYIRFYMVIFMIYIYIYSS